MPGGRPATSISGRGGIPAPRHREHRGGHRVDLHHCRAPGQRQHRAGHRPMTAVAQPGGVIDVHAHWLPRSLFGLPPGAPYGPMHDRDGQLFLGDLPLSIATESMSDEAAIIEDMDRAGGVAVRVLSAPPVRVPAQRRAGRRGLRPGFQHRPGRCRVPDRRKAAGPGCRELGRLRGDHRPVDGLARYRGHCRGGHPAGGRGRVPAPRRVAAHRLRGCALGPCRTGPSHADRASGVGGLLPGQSHRQSCRNRHRGRESGPERCEG